MRLFQATCLGFADIWQI